MTVYLDNNATTPPHREVVESMLPFLKEQWGNASSVHYPGRRARETVEKARADVAALIGAPAERIVFTGSGTEADNLAVIGSALAAREAGRGRHVVTSAIEHHAVLHSVRHLEALGFEATFVAPDGAGRVAAEAVLTAVRKDTVLVSLMHANNETGVLQPVDRISTALRERGCLLHSDAVQTVAKIPVNVEALGVDLLSLSAHKLHGPQGVGALYVRKGVPIQGLLFGGAQEDGLRPGTYNVAAIVGFGTAARLAKASLGEDGGYLQALMADLETGLRRIAPKAVALGRPEQRLPNTLNVCFPGVDNQALVASLDALGVAISTGAACTTGSAETSHVLRAMGVEETLARGAVRFSLGTTNSFEDIEAALKALEKALGDRRGRS